MDWNSVGECFEGNNCPYAMQNMLREWGLVYNETTQESAFTNTEKVIY
jgi:hypothetical protein